MDAGPDKSGYSGGPDPCVGLGVERGTPKKGSVKGELLGLMCEVAHRTTLRYTTTSSTPTTLSMACFALWMFFTSCTLMRNVPAFS